MLELRHITKSFGHTLVLDDISVSFTAGSVTAIVGDNGAGKSTLLKLIAGMHDTDAGGIYVDNIDITKAPVAARRRHGIEMVYQDLALTPQQSILANLFLGREPSVPRFGFLNRRSMVAQARRIIAALDTGLPDLKTAVSVLSGGQQQTVAIARATMFDPKVLLLDEPTAALAAGQVDRVLAMIRREKDAGRVVILVSHRLNDVFAVADRIVVMQHGRIASDLPSVDTSLAATVETIIG